MIRALVSIALAAGWGAAWLVRRGHRNPRRWPDALSQETDVLRRDIDEAMAAGRSAARRAEREFDETIAREGPGS